MKTNFDFANLFNGLTVTDTDSVAEAIKTYKSFTPANDEEHKAALTALIDFINNGNKEIEALAISKVATDENIVKAMLPEIAVSEAEKTKSFKRKMAVYLAVSYPQFAIAKDTTAQTEQYIVRKKIVPVTLAKVFKYICKQKECCCTQHPTVTNFVFCN